jgi:DNA-binding SARP family transcriptional activator
MGVSPSPEENRFSFLGFIRSLLQRQSGPGINEQDVIDITPTILKRTGVNTDSSGPPGTTEESEIDVRPVHAYPPAADLVQDSFPCIPVSAHMLGDFNVTIQETNLKLPASRSLSLFKYLLLHHKQHTPREVLMEVFWPDAEPETARNNQNVAIHSLRRAIRSVIFLPVIVFRDGAYGFENNVEVWLDVEEFERCVNAGQRLEARHQRTAAIAEYEAAISLYKGDFLEQNPYEEWTVLERERLRVAYLETLDRLSQIYFGQERYAMCITVCKLILTRDRCREDAHSLLMRCYSRQGQDHLALRQYQICVEALRMELDVAPAPETTKLYEQVRQHKRV